MGGSTKERHRTAHAYNLHLINRDDCDHNGLPVLTPTTYIPTALIGFNQARTTTRHDAAVHFFIDDYQFERVWRRPEQYLSLLAQFPAILAPDFSLYWDMPAPMQQWNIYRSRALAAYWQHNGVTVIPTLQWAQPDTWPLAHSGLHGGTVAVSAIGCHSHPHTRQRWIDGMTHALHTIQPTHVICHGQPIRGFNWQDTPHTIINNDVITRMEAHRGRTR